MKYKPYDEYKKSGVNLLEQIPKNWQKYSFKELFTKKEITNLTNEGLLSVYLDRGVIPYSEGGGLVHKPSESLEKYQLVDINDFVMNNQQAWRGSVGISNYRGIVSPAYLVFSTDKEKADPSYLKYLLKDNISVSQFSLSSLSVGTIQRQVKWHLLRNISLFLPSLDDQLKISKFLDKEILKIDNLISKQKQLIQLLEEQRKAVILQAITKGLNLDLSMKQSGIDWIGAMPKKWQLKRLKQIASVVLGKMICNENQGDMLLKPYLKSKNIQWLNVNLNSVDEMWFSAKELDVYKLHKDDLILSEGGEVGKTCIWNNELDECYIQNSAHKVTLCEGYNAHYYLYFFYSMGHLGQFDRVINKVSIAHLTKEKLLNIPVLIPSIDEQNQIVEFIESENRKINNLINKQSKLIEKLKEYRSSIISHAVTGKIDVREAL